MVDADPDNNANAGADNQTKSVHISYLAPF